MAQVIMVHGMAANAASWFDLDDDLRAMGHDVTAETLPGHDGPLAYIFKTETMSDYLAQLQGFLPAAGKTWLIGHSLGGFVISQLAAQNPDRVAGLIYVCALLPRDGQAPSSMLRFNPQNLFTEYDDHGGLPAIGHALASQPMAPLSAVFSGEAVLATLSKSYVLCTKDLIIDPGAQRAMAEAYEDVSVTVLEADHLPQHETAAFPGARQALIDTIRATLDT